MICGLVTDKRLERECSDCRQVVTHVMVDLGKGRFELRPVPHQARCNRPCAISDHLGKPMIDLHFSGCECSLGAGFLY